MALLTAFQIISIFYCILPLSSCHFYPRMQAQQGQMILFISIVRIYMCVCVIGKTQVLLPDVRNLTQTLISDCLKK